jgi:hypothetical protein
MLRRIMQTLPDLDKININRLHSSPQAPREHPRADIPQTITDRHSPIQARALEQFVPGPETERELQDDFLDIDKPSVAHLTRQFRSAEVVAAELGDAVVQFVDPVSHRVGVGHGPIVAFRVVEDFLELEISSWFQGPDHSLSFEAGRLRWRGRRTGEHVARVVACF